MNKEAQLTTLMIMGFAVTLFGWAIVHLSSLERDEFRFVHILSLPSSVSTVRV